MLTEKLEGAKTLEVTLKRRESEFAILKGFRCLATYVNHDGEQRDKMNRRKD